MEDNLHLIGVTFLFKYSLPDYQRLHCLFLFEPIPTTPPLFFTRFVILWDEGLRKVKTFSILDASPLPVSSALHSVCTDPRGMKILVASKSGDLYEVRG